jgi:RNA polymerase sigma-70 factor, ECF subfamily
MHQFERVVRPHLDAAFNLACWLTRSRVDAQDVVQEAAIRAYKYLDTFAGRNARAWVLVIVRRTCFHWMRQKKVETPSFADRREQDARRWIWPAAGADRDEDPETLLLKRRERQRLHQLIASLPPYLREVIILREFDEASYREIAQIVGIPIGTVMSRLARAREELKRRGSIILQRGPTSNSGTADIHVA